MDINWQVNFAHSWLDRVEQGRLPHAVLLTGPVGVGKRAAASWMVARKLHIGTPAALPQYPFEPAEHPDLRWIEPAEAKEAIGIEQIRELIRDMSLTSYAGGGKAAVIDPANAMTRSAANSLLKTLEEPSGDALIILIADRTGRLPATIFSRCQRIDFAPPAQSEGLAWLDRLQPNAAWAKALQITGNAPLAAISAIAEIDTTIAMGRDFAAIAGGRVSALEVAAKWARIDPHFVLDWLARQLQMAILTATGGRAGVAGLAIDESGLRGMDRRNLFCYLDTINRLRGQPAGSYNVQLTLEGLLIDWAEGLKNCRQDAQLDGSQLMLVKR